MLSRLLTSLFIVAVTPLYAGDLDGFYDDGKWEFIKEKKGFKIYSREMPGTSLLGFKVEGHINAPIIDIMSNLRDIQYATEWQPDLKEKVSIEDRGADEAITYSKVDMPWPLDDRDYVLHNKLLVNKEKKLLYVISKSVKHEGWNKARRAVRANIGYSNIGLRPVDGDKTYVEWTLFGDPSGNIPNWVVNFYQQKFPIDFFKTLEERANTKKIPVMPGLHKKLAELTDAMKEKDGRVYASESK